MDINQKNKLFCIFLMFICHDFTVSRPYDYEKILWLRTKTNYIFPNSINTETYRTSTAALLACTLALILVVIGVLIFMYVLSVRSVREYSQARVQIAVQEQFGIVQDQLFNDAEEFTVFYDPPPSYETVTKLLDLVPPPPSYDDDCIIKLPPYLPKIGRSTNAISTGTIQQSGFTSLETLWPHQLQMSEHLGEVLRNNNCTVICNRQLAYQSECQNLIAINQHQPLSTFFLCLRIPSSKQTKYNLTTIPPFKIHVPPAPHNQACQSKTRQHDDDNLKYAFKNVLMKWPSIHERQEKPDEIPPLMHTLNFPFRLHVISNSLSHTGLDSFHFPTQSAISDLSQTSIPNKSRKHADPIWDEKGSEKYSQETPSEIQHFFQNTPTQDENDTSICDCVGACACHQIL